MSAKIKGKASASSVHHPKNAVASKTKGNATVLPSSPVTRSRASSIASSSRSVIEEQETGEEEDADDSDDDDEGEDEDDNDDDDDDEEMQDPKETLKTANNDQDSSSKSHVDIKVESQDDEMKPKFDYEKAKTKLHYLAKTLRSSTKKIRAFQLQRLVKKLKQTRKMSQRSLSSAAAATTGDTKSIEVEDLELELEALKGFDIHFWATRALIAKMGKMHLLPKGTKKTKTMTEEQQQEYPFLELVLQEPLLGVDALSGDQQDLKEQDERNRKARERASAQLISSKVLADEVTRQVEELRKFIEPVQPKTKGKETNNRDERVQNKEEEEDDNDRVWSGDEDDQVEEEFSEASAQEDQDDSEGLDEAELERIGKQKIAALGNLSQWDGLIGSDSEQEDDDSEDDDSEDEESDSKSKSQRSSSTVNRKLPKRKRSASVSSSFSSDIESEQKETIVKRSKVEKKPKTKTKTKKEDKEEESLSTFLPSLSVGFIAGRSDDDWSDGEADLADRDISELKSGKKKDTKNRMGQRARRAIWEKKFGRTANHVQLREKDRKERPFHSNKTSLETANTSGGARSNLYPRSHLLTTPVVPSTSSSSPYASRFSNHKDSSSTSDPAPMHPSWIAKQKQKELLANVKPAGKKIVFD